MAATTTRETAFQVRAMLCDTAVVAEGKLYIQGGGWNQLNSPSFPFQLPRLGIAIVMDVDWNSTNKAHHLKVELVDEDGQPHTIPTLGEDGQEVAGAIRAEADFTIGRPPNVIPGDYQILSFAMNFDGIPFSKPGAYNLIIAIDDYEYERLTFRVLSAVPSQFRMG